MLVGGAALCLCLSTRTAIADTPASTASGVRAEGEALGKKGLFVDAIERFKKAEALEPAAENDCFVAISYARLKKWTQAKLFIERCRSRTGGVPKLAWYGQAESLINNSLSKEGYATILLRSAPLGARVHLDGTPEDERFETPISLWLPAGSHAITVEKDDFASGHAELLAVAQQRRTEEVVLQALVVEHKETPETVETPVTGETATTVETAALVEASPVEIESSEVTYPQASHTAAWLSFAAGASCLAGGMVAHGYASSSRSRAQDPANDYDAEIESFKRRRLITVSLYGAAGVLGGLGTYLLMRDSASEGAQSGLSVDVSADSTHASVGLGGQF